MSAGDQYVQTAADVWAGALDERDATIRELQAELARVRALGLDATDRAERLASELTDLRAENERLRRERDAKAEPEHPDFKHQSPRVAIEVWNKQLRNALGLLTHNEHPISETADAVSDVLRLVSVLREQVEALRRERDALIQRRFPIMDGPSIPWSVIAPHEAQAQRNHDQTLELLAQRGGLGAIEAVAVLEDQAYPRGRDVQAEKARCLAVLNAINDKHAALAARAEKAEAERDEWKAKAEAAEAECNPPDACATHGRCWAHSTDDLDEMTTALNETGIHTPDLTLEQATEELRRDGVDVDAFVAKGLANIALRKAMRDYAVSRKAYLAADASVAHDAPADATDPRVYEVFRTRSDFHDAQDALERIVKEQAIAMVTEGA